MSSDIKGKKNVLPVNQSRFSMRTCRFLNPVLKDGSGSFTSSLAMKWLIFKKINKNSLNCWAFSWPCLLLPSTSWSCSWVSPYPQLHAFCCWLVGWLHVVWSASWHVCVCAEGLHVCLLGRVCWDLLTRGQSVSILRTRFRRCPAALSRVCFGFVSVCSLLWCPFLIISLLLYHE